MELNLTDWFNLINIVIHILGREKEAVCYFVKLFRKNAKTNYESIIIFKSRMFEKRAYYKYIYYILYYLSVHLIIFLAIFSNLFATLIII